MMTIRPARQALKRVEPIKFERKLLKTEIVQAEHGIVEGYASLFGVTDQAGDRVAQGAFARSLRERKTHGVRMLYQHLANEPIGIWTLIQEDTKGLFVRGRIINGVERARDVLTLLREGAIDGLSIGYRTVAAERRSTAAIRTLTEIDLWEVSIVTFPMLDGARVTSVKARAGTKTKTQDATGTKGSNLWTTAPWKQRQWPSA